MKQKALENMIHMASFTIVLRSRLFFLVVFFQFRAVSQLKYGNDLASKTVSKALIEQIEQVSIYLRARMVISGLYCENNQHNEVHLNFRQSILSLRAFPTIFSYFS